MVEVLNYIESPDVAFILVLGLLLGFLLGLTLYLSKSKRWKTREYRKVLTDMYVVGKLKQYAKKEGLNLVELLKEYRQINNILKEPISIDETIEQELTEKIHTKPKPTQE